jgi:uracil phosphoribosyltransferase
MEGSTNVILLKQTPQVVGLHTIIRRDECSREDFIFYSDRLIRLVIEEGLNLAPVQPIVIKTSTNSEYIGVEFKKRICGVSIVRAGESMESALREVCRDVRIGKILIQRDEESAKPIMFYSKLPQDINSRLVFLMDPMLATGGSAGLAIQTLKDRGVKEENIILLNLISAPEGIKFINSNFPGVQMVTSAIDDHLNEKKFIIPGIGDFGDKYFGTT